MTALRNASSRFMAQRSAILRLATPCIAMPRRVSHCAAPFRDAMHRNDSLGDYRRSAARRYASPCHSARCCALPRATSLRTVTHRNDCLDNCQRYAALLIAAPRHAARRFVSHLDAPQRNDCFGTLTAQRSVARRPAPPCSVALCLVMSRTALPRNATISIRAFHPAPRGIAARRDALLRVSAPYNALLRTAPQRLFWEFSGAPLCHAALRRTMYLTATQLRSTQRNLNQGG